MMRLALLALVASFAYAVSGDLYDRALDRALDDCRSCYLSGYDISVRAGGEHESFGTDSGRARRWAQRQSGCDISVYVTARQDGARGVGVATECKR